MRLSRALGILLLLAVAYVGVLAWADVRNGVFDRAADLWVSAPVLFAASLASYVVRYARWHWLLVRAGHRVAVVPGFLAYVAGFAFTATPGKVGELLRVRYYGQQAVPAATVVAAFVFERALDLMVVLALASLYLARPDMSLYVAVFVLGFLGCVAAAACRPAMLSWIAAQVARRGAAQLARLVQLVGDSLVHARRWLTLPDLLVSLAAGAAAWLLTSWAFLALLRHLTDVSVSTVEVLGIYPLAMLAGAASMLPGGIGSTELALVALLLAIRVPVGAAAVAAVGIRLGTLWFAIACGIAAAAVLEWKQASAQGGASTTLGLPHDRPSPP